MTASPRSTRFFEWSQSLGLNPPFSPSIPLPRYSTMDHFRLDRPTGPEVIPLIQTESHNAISADPGVVASSPTSAPPPGPPSYIRAPSQIFDDMNPVPGSPYGPSGPPQGPDNTTSLSQAQAQLSPGFRTHAGDSPSPSNLYPRSVLTTQSSLQGDLYDPYYHDRNR